MKENRKYFYLDDFEHRLLVVCLMTARNKYLRESKPLEDINNLILKIVDAPKKKLNVIVKDQTEWRRKLSSGLSVYHESGKSSKTLPLS